MQDETLAEIVKAAALRRPDDAGYERLRHGLNKVLDRLSERDELLVTLYDRIGRNEDNSRVSDDARWSRRVIQQELTALHVGKVR